MDVAGGPTERPTRCAWGGVGVRVLTLFRTWGRGGSLALTLVPEPTTLGVVGAVMVLSLRRRAFTMTASLASR